MMKLKTVEVNGKTCGVVQDGKPVYVVDGKDVAYDAPADIATISRLSGELKSHREHAEKAEGDLKKFEDIGVRGIGRDFYQGRYEAELKKCWLKNKRSTQQMKLLGQLDRRPRLRGQDFVHELARLCVLTKERCFRDAVYALVKHGIINQHLNFTRWRPPSEAENKNRLIMLIRFYVRCGMTKRRACAEVAARVGLRAVSFKAAIKHLQILESKASSGKMP
jgi:hypothetical protein